MKVLNVSGYALLFWIVIMAGCGDLGVNRTIHIPDGEKRTTDLNAVNGAIIIGRDCEIRGTCRTVNGGIEIGESSFVRTLMAINGSISVSAKTRINGEVTTINGSIDCENGVVIKDEVSTINGDITLNGTQIEYDVKTINGDILLGNKTVVRGDVVIRSRKSRKGFSEDHAVIQITVQDSSVVEGDIINRDDTRPVRVILAGGGEVKGRILKAEVIRE